jgi:hypothetical protein
MDDHTEYQLRQADEQIRRAELIIERQRLHIGCLHPSRRHGEQRRLQAMMSDYTRLVNERQALLDELPRPHELRS